MGMDVIGTAPTSETGEYFRANIWWWHPLADFLTATFPEETGGCTYWHSNDGDGLDGPGAAALAAALEDALSSSVGAVDQHTERLLAEAATVPRERCQWCEGTGLRRDKVGLELGLDKRNPRTGKGGCNACQGLGTTLPHEAHVCFDREHVEEFAAFLRDCGGFRIH